MALNTKIFSERLGQIKILSIILGAIAVFLTADHWYSIDREEAFWWTLLVCFIISCILFVLSILGLMDSDNFQKLDKIFHALAAIAVIISACFFIYSVDYYHRYTTIFTNYYERRAAAGGFGLGYGVVCAWIGWFILH